MEQGPSHRVSEVKRALKVISSLSLAVLESLSLSSLAAGPPLPHHWVQLGILRAPVLSWEPASLLPGPLLVLALGDHPMFYL